MASLTSPGLVHHQRLARVRLASTAPWPLCAEAVLDFWASRMADMNIGTLESLNTMLKLYALTWGCSLHVSVYLPIQVVGLSGRVRFKILKL